MLYFSNRCGGMGNPSEGVWLRYVSLKSPPYPFALKKAYRVEYTLGLLSDESASSRYAHEMFCLCFCADIFALFCFGFLFI